MRKVFGIRGAFKDVKKESDWKASGKSKSKIDYEMWDRIDPSRRDEEHVFVNCKVETELRTEMEREASMLKAKMKLTENKKGTYGTGFRDFVLQGKQGSCLRLLSFSQVLFPQFCCG